MRIRRNVPKRRTPDPQQDINEPSLYGGHLPHPPETCSYRDFAFIGRDKRPYIDLGICIAHCESKTCDRHKEWLKVLASNRKAHFDKTQSQKESIVKANPIEETQKPVGRRRRA